ncbi:radical SAM protein [Sulfurimonas sp.]|uniref:radical SAM protein n=2 Tax=Sulfurimonas sp. TaxID=2022749 RepID=UPI003D1524CC
MSATVLAENNIIFGPINSRRFGMSLGIDLSPATKQCNFDCLYCELAPTATVDKQDNAVSAETIITELKKHLNNKIDVITLTANGEPTLYPYLNELIDQIDIIKGDTQTLILTNSAMLSDEKVYNSLLKLDQVKLSLDAITPEIFKKIDRPHQNINIDDIVKKVQQFSQKFNGKLFIEILFVHGLNDTKEEVLKLNNALLSIKANRIDLGTIDRPPAYPVSGISYKELYELSQLFDASLPVHIASRVHAEANNTSYTNEEIINTLDKRPLTMQDIELLFDEESKNRLLKLIEEQVIIVKKLDNLEFFTPTTHLIRKKDK